MELNTSSLNLLFPFYFIIDDEMKIKEIGEKLQKLCPEIMLDQPFSHFFAIQRPFLTLNLESMIVYTKSLFILKFLPREISFKNQIIYDEPRRQIIFLGSPNVKDLASLSQLKLDINDFALHDRITDFLFLFQSQIKAIADTQALNTSLYEKQVELETANIKLAEQAEYQHEQTKLVEKLMLDYKKAKEDAEAANKLKSEFLANVSHELRTPLNAIIGYSEIIQEDATDTAQQEYIDNAQKVLDSATHLLNLINNVLDLSKIEAGKMDVFLEDIKVETLIHQMQNIITPLMSKNNNTFAWRISPDVDIMHTDTVRIRQSLINLLSNATKFTQNGRVDLDISLVSQNSKEWVQFSVRDTGIGLSPEKIAKLFQPFIQADGTTTRKYGGTGLGLYLTKRFCEMLGGWIRVQSEEGVGSEFIMALPLKSLTGVEKQDFAASISEISNWADFKGKAVLIIDDDPVVHEEVETMLTKSGFMALHAFNGEEGVNMARQYRPHVIMLDVVMPIMDGWSVISALKSDPQLAEIPVIMITVISEKELGFSLGAVDYVSKPVDMKSLVNKIKQFAPSEERPVLIADDDPNARQLMRTAAQKVNWEVIECTNGREVLEQLAVIYPSVLLLDLMMPEVDGFMVINEMQKNEKWRQIPVIILTAKDLTLEERTMLSKYSQCILGKDQPEIQTLLNAVCSDIKTQAN